jgi:hypothetical protein
MKNNNPYLAGVPDVWYSGSAGDLWVEYKYVATVPKKGTVKIALTALQSAWLCERQHEGRNVAVIIGSKLGGVILTDEAWKNDLDSTAYQSQILTRIQLAQYIIARVEKDHGNQINPHHLHSNRKPSTRGRASAD